MNRKFIIRLLTAAFFIVLLGVAFFLHDDYGGFTDEMMEIETAGINLKYIQSKIFPDSKLPDVPTFNWEDLPELQEYEDKTYGATVMLPTLFVNTLPGVELNRAQFLDFRRFYTFLNFWLALICFYFLIRMRFENDLIALGSCLMLAFSPRFFAESFYNVKDMIFFCWFLISLFGIGWFMLRRNVWGLVVFCLSFGLTSNVRNFGVALWPAFICLALLDCLSQKHGKKSVRRILIAYLCAAFASLLCYWLFTPCLWEHTLTNLRDGLLFSADQIGIGDAELFMGKIVAPKDYWYYLPVWISITTPVVVLMLFFVGVFFVFRTILQRRLVAELDAPYLFDFFCLGLFVVFMSGIIAVHATIYHGWRQCYFLYAPLSYLAARGLSGLSAIPSRRYVLQIVLVCVCLLSIGGNAFWILQNHPMDFCYFNLVGRRYATQFSRDYWGVSSKKCVYDLSALYDGREIVLGVNSDQTWGSTLFSVWRLSDDLQSRFRTVWQDKNADYLCFGYKHTQGNGHEIEGFDLIRSYRIGSYDVAGMYKRH